jgi:hypothetical protein
MFVRRPFHAEPDAVQLAALAIIAHTGSTAEQRHDHHCLDVFEAEFVR